MKNIWNFLHQNQTFSISLYVKNSFVSDFWFFFDIHKFSQPREEWKNF